VREDLAAGLALEGLLLAGLIMRVEKPHVGGLVVARGALVYLSGLALDCLGETAAAAGFWCTSKCLTSNSRLGKVIEQVPHLKKLV